MKKQTVFFLLLMSLVMGTTAHSQQNPEQKKIEETSGTVIKVNVQEAVLYLDSYGNQMAFSVPKDAIISLETRPVTLADVKNGDSVSVRYYSSSAAVYVVMSINDSRPKTVQSDK